MRARILIAAAFAWAALAETPLDFRQAAWGMTSAQVMASEPMKAPAIRRGKRETVVEYNSIGFAGLQGRLLYVFADDKLVRATIVFDTEHTAADEFIGDFRLVEPVLLERYGKPTTDRAIWENDETQEPKSYLDQDRATATGIFPSDNNVGLAVSLGHVKLFTERAGRRTKIVHAMTGADGRITHQVEFSAARSAP